jgi:hypothetical protein
MTAAREWLMVRISDAPDGLRERMLAALNDTNANDGKTQDLLARAATACMQRAMTEQPRRDCALDLLAADALLTHACEAAAEQGSEALAAFTGSWNAERFEQLLQAAS